VFKTLHFSSSQFPAPSR